MKQTAFVAVLATLVVSGLFLSSNNAFAADHKAKPGDTVEASDGDSIEVDVSEEASDGKAPAPKAKKGADAKLKPAAVDAKVAPMDVEGTKKVEKAEQTPSKIMVDDFTEAKSTDQEDTDSVVEVAMRGVLHPSGPAIGGTLGFSWRPANRVRIHVGFDASKGLLELKGAEAELAQFGFTAAVTRAMTRTVEIGAFGTMSWAYRDLVKDVSASFVGVGPGFRVNKASSLIFFEAAIPIGLGKKFANSGWELNHSIQASLGFHF